MGTTQEAGNTVQESHHPLEYVGSQVKHHVHALGRNGYIVLAAMFSYTTGPLWVMWSISRRHVHSTRTLCQVLGPPESVKFMFFGAIKYWSEIEAKNRSCLMHGNSVLLITPQRLLPYPNKRQRPTLHLSRTGTLLVVIVNCCQRRAYGHKPPNVCGSKGQPPQYTAKDNF